MKKSTNKPNSKVQQLKAQFSNSVHKILDPHFNKTSAEKRKLGVVRFTDAQKIEMFNEVANIHSEISSRISTTRFNKRAAKRRYLKMVEEGTLPKQKTTLAQWIAMKNESAVA